MLSSSRLLYVSKINELRIGENLSSITASRKRLDSLVEAKNSYDVARSLIKQSQRNISQLTQGSSSQGSHVLNVFRQNQAFSLFSSSLDTKVKQLSQKLSENILERRAEINSLFTKNTIYQHKRDIARARIRSDKKTMKLVSENCDASDYEDKLAHNRARIKTVKNR